jgi:asparagine synthase (glutamine-hydrolysing)
MAGIAGIFYADGRPADISELRRMTGAIEQRGPDGITFWQSGPVAFAHLQFCTTPESLEERQPLVSPSGEVCLVWNGRLDNREELLNALAAKGERPVDFTDPGLVLSAYLAWGTECVEGLVGDFALAIWDARLRRLWCARDYIGIRPFYYFWDGKTFLFAPEIRGLLAHPLVSLRINEGMVGEYLADAISSREETLYLDIRRLPSGSTLTVDATGELRRASWWKPELSLIEYGNDSDYAEHFLQLMEQSVRSQTRCNGRWATALSGGLDSSSIAATAQALMNGDGSGIDSDGSCGHERALAFSVVCRGKPWDESEDVGAVVRHAGLNGEFLQPFKANLEFFRQKASCWREFPGNPNGEPVSIPIYEAARRCGVQVLLNGIGGDEWLSGRLLDLADLAAAGKVRELQLRARSDWELYDGRGHWSIFLARTLARQLLAGAMPNWMRSRRRAHRLDQHSILSREFLRRTHLVSRIHAQSERKMRHFATRGQQSIFDFATGAAEAHVFELNDRELASAGLEARYPFFDRRLAEFCLRLPDGQRQRGTVSKWVLRNAMRGRLPERIRRKAFKAEFSELFEAVLRGPVAKSRLENLVLCQHTDWLDRKRFAALVDFPEDSARARFRYWRAWMVLGVDLWYETLKPSHKS